MLVRFNDSDPGMIPAPASGPVAEMGPMRSGPQIDIAAILSAVRRQKYLVGAAALVGLALGVLHVLTAPRVYMASTEVMIGEDVAGVSNGFNRPATVTQNEVMLESALRVLQSQTLALAVVNKLDLHEREAFVAPPRSLPGGAVQFLRGLAGAVLSGGSGSEAEADPEAAAMKQRIAAAENLRENIDVRREGRSSVFLLRYTSSDPELVAAVVNAYGEAFVSDQLIGNVEASARVLDWLQNRLFVIQENSTQAALRAEEFRARSGLETIAGEPITVQMIAQLNADIADATVQLARTRALSSIYDELRQLDPLRFIESGAAGARVPDAEFSAGQERLMVLQQRLDEVELRYGPDHSEVVQLRERIEAEGRALQREMQRLYETTANAVRALESEISILRNSISEISAENLDLATSRVELRALERQAEIFDALNETYLLRLKDLEQTQTFPVTNVRVLSFADIPEDPISPRKSLALGFMLLLGAAAGGGLALWRERIHRFIRTREDLQEASGLPFLGYMPLLAPDEIEGATVPEIAGKKAATAGELRKGFKHDFAALRHPRSQFTETLRNIRVTLESSTKGQTGYVLGVVSIRPGEGKTTTAENLAALAALAGRSVLLVDADVRTSSLSRRLRQSMGVGLREVLMGRADWEASLRREVNTGLHFLPSTFSANDSSAGDQVGSPEFRNLITEARRRYSLTIIDLAPLAPVSDARALVPVLDGLVMVLEWGKVSRETLRDILSVDHVLYEKLIGIALNKADMSALAKYSQTDPFEGYYDAQGEKEN
ncbi:GNVR domain-containing protein [Tabrizicola sp.]|uniref:AAA family ATPase n=1 Tax=Tabrizicola sp. TaxID=2005166 RepID=UPI0026230B17|nr:GNVR domain-containing protein [Tabrizicola sp.]MDM7932746.1 AAA family ATPase [Tabrizicola sp.]